MSKRCTACSRWAASCIVTKATKQKEPSFDWPKIAFVDREVAAIISSWDDVKWTSSVTRFYVTVCTFWKCLSCVCFGPVSWWFVPPTCACLLIGDLYCRPISRISSEADQLFKMNKFSAPTEAINLHFSSINLSCSSENNVFSLIWLNLKIARNYPSEKKECFADKRTQIVH